MLIISTLGWAFTDEENKKTANQKMILNFLLNIALTNKLYQIYKKAYDKQAYCPFSSRGSEFQPGGWLVLSEENPQ